MAATNGRTADANSIPIPEQPTAAVQSLMVRQESGEVIAMEILPPSTPETIGERVLSSVISELDRLVDKTPIQPFIIATQAEATDTAKRIIDERTKRATVLEKIEPFSKFVNIVHKSITGKRAEYTMAIDGRLAVLDSASVAWDDKCEREKREEDERLAALARKQEDERRKEEAKSLKKRGFVEEAREVLTAPPTSFRPSSSSRSVSGVKGFGFKKSFTAECEDVDRLLLGVARPTLYREIATLLGTKDFKKLSAAQIAKELLARSGQFPQVPSNVFCSTKAAEEALDTKLTAYANNSDGKMDWPGVIVTTDKKTTGRVR